MLSFRPDIRHVGAQIRTGRGVPISSQLRSHQLFSQNFDCFTGLVDSATLYHTGARYYAVCILCRALQCVASLHHRCSALRSLNVAVGLSGQHMQ